MSLMSDSYLLIYALAILPLSLSSPHYSSLQTASRIPTIGPSAPLLSYYGVYKFLIHGPDMIREGYNKLLRARETQHKGSAFKIADLNGWHSCEKRGDDQLSSEEALNELVQTQYTLGPSIRDNPYHIPVVRSQLTRNLAEIFPEVHDEIIASFTDAIPLTGDGMSISLFMNMYVSKYHSLCSEWTAVPALDTIMQVICRTTNRIFVGLPSVCTHAFSLIEVLVITGDFSGRNPDYSALNVQFTIDVAKGAMIIKLFPNILRPYVTTFGGCAFLFGSLYHVLFPTVLRHLLTQADAIAARLFTNVNASMSRGVRHLEGMILERYRAMEEFGDEWPDKPVCTHSPPSSLRADWLMDVAQGEERTVRALVLRILAANFAAIHSSSMTFTQALYYLAANPEFVGPLREEVDAIISTDGWSKAAMDKMRKIDSFLKESQRFAE
ncbi:Ent-kaurene oxidase [Grifola frondosa]|uniref:Ent-kaurene oxidase n=1 Tax=Grifola frondosa TaxID=5627 RepID=A0A1C7MEM3_GRIFR|nr:Ent-kaurene oxidase [Grifola frondosa]